MKFPFLYIQFRLKRAKDWMLCRRGNQNGKIGDKEIRNVDKCLNEYICRPVNYRPCLEKGLDQLIVKIGTDR